MIAFAILALAMLGCKANEQAAMTHIDQLEQDIKQAEASLQEANNQVTAIRDAQKQALSRTWSVDLEIDAAEARLQIRRLIFEKTELDKSLETLQDTLDELNARLANPAIDPTIEEQELLNNTNEVQAINQNLQQLQAAREQQLAKFGDPKTVVESIDQRIAELQNERNSITQEQLQILVKAKREQAKLGLLILGDEIQKANEALAEWAAKRQENLRLHQEFETLERELEQAEKQRDRAQQHLADLIEERKNPAR